MAGFGEYQGLGDDECRVSTEGSAASSNSLYSVMLSVAQIENRVRTFYSPPPYQHTCKQKK